MLIEAQRAKRIKKMNSLREMGDTIKYINRHLNRNAGRRGEKKEQKKISKNKKLPKFIEK